MPKMGGLDVLKAVKASSPDTVVLMITAFASADSAVEAMKHGAYDYLTKPFQVDEVQLIIRNAIEAAPAVDGEHAPEAGIGQPVVVLPDRGPERGHAEGLRCHQESGGFQEQRPDRRGKRHRQELVARAIHFNSARASMPS